MTTILLDTETNGQEPQEPIEVAWVELEEGPAFFLNRKTNIHIDRYKPKLISTYGALATHHIMPEELRKCKPSSEAIIPPTDYLIGHNVDFDWQVMGQPPCKRICTLAMARVVYPRVDSYSLVALSYYLRGANLLVKDVVKNAHCALDDVALCHWILQAIVDERYITDMESLYVFSEKCRIPEIISFGKHKGTPIWQLPKSYVQWLLRQPDLDPYLQKAIEKYCR